MGGASDLENVILRIVDERIAHALASIGRGDIYSSNALPPDCASRRAFAAACKVIPGAKKRGKCWVVPRVAWDAHRTKPRRSTASIDAMIAAAGFRPTRKVA
jgi:hypothetical protein